MLYYNIVYMMQHNIYPMIRYCVIPYNTTLYTYRMMLYRIVSYNTTFDDIVQDDIVQKLQFHRNINRIIYHVLTITFIK